MQVKIRIGVASTPKKYTATKKRTHAHKKAQTIRVQTMDMKIVHVREEQKERQPVRRRGEESRGEREREGKGGQEKGARETLIASTRAWRSLAP